MADNHSENTIERLKWVCGRVDKNHVLPRWAKRRAYNGEMMNNQPATQETPAKKESILRPWLYGYSSAALPVSAISAVGLFLGARTESTLLTCAVIELLPLGAFAGYKAMRTMRKNCGDSVAGFIVCCALLLGAALPVVAHWFRH